MVIARQHGYNSISLGGCNNIPTAMLNMFADRCVYIVYDNDNPGRLGATKLASALYAVTKNVYIANIGDYVKEEKEDITDFFIKYKFGNIQFDEMLENAEVFGVLSNFIGMTTDSRSFLSFVRHDYFRRVLCSWLVEKNERECWDLDEHALSKLVKKICYENLKERISYGNI
jgi:glucuronate isomerase